MTTVRGTVYDGDGNPATRQVRVYRRDTGALLGSDSSDGAIFDTFAEWASADGSDSAGWSGYTMRVVINSSLIGPCNKIKLTFRSSISVGAVMSKAYVGEAAASGDAYDFATTPAQILFSGSAGVSIAANSSVQSDEVIFSTDGTKNLVVSIYFTGTSNVRAKATQSGWSGFYKLGDSAATVDESGYTTGSNSYCLLKVEGSNAEAGEYLIDCGAYTGEVQIVCLDDDAGSLENDLILRTFPV